MRDSFCCSLPQPPGASVMLPLSSSSLSFPGFLALSHGCEGSPAGAFRGAARRSVCATGGRQGGLGVAKGAALLLAWSDAVPTTAGRADVLLELRELSPGGISLMHGSHVPRHVHVWSAALA